MEYRENIINTQNSIKLNITKMVVKYKRKAKNKMKIIGALLILLTVISCGSSKSSRYIYWVNSAKVPCTGVQPMQCLQVQKSDTINWDNWQFLYSNIEGFKYEPGYIYKLLVNEEKIKAEQVPADASSLKHSLVKVLEKNVDIRLRINDIWILESIKGEKIQINNSPHKKIPQLELNVAEMKINGNDGCNNFFGGIKSLTTETIEFTPLASTKMACLDTDIPDKFNGAFIEVSKYIVEYNQLVLKNIKDESILTFRKTD